MDWPVRLVQALAQEHQPRLVFQPIVDLARGVVAGYEALARFDVAPYAPPDQWFDAASAHGCSASLEARVVRLALQCLPGMPSHTFLTINLDPDQAADAEVLAAFATAGRLDRLVVEVTERSAIEGDARLLEVLADLRGRGAVVALDDVGAGYAGLQAILRLRPQMVKLDRSLVERIDDDPARRTIVRQIGGLAGDLDAWVLAEGVERLQELETLLALDVPLAQGWLLGRPEPEPTTTVPGEVVAVVQRHRRHAAEGRSVAGIVVTPRTTASHLTRDLSLQLLDDEDAPCVVGVDRHGRPVSVLTRQRAVDGLEAVADPMTVKPTDALADVARRAMVRPPSRRFSPVPVVDERGVLTGVVLVEHLISALAVTNPG